jgi:DNA-binding CsgD family transcriptional regulator
MPFSSKSRSANKASPKADVVRMETAEQRIETEAFQAGDGEFGTAVIGALMSAAPILSSMTSPIELQDVSGLAMRLRSRGDLTAFLTELAGSVGAESYMLLAVPQGRAASEARILSSNWVFDVIELLGHGLIQRIAASHWSAMPGVEAQPILAAGSFDSEGVVNGEEARLLDVLGHGELWSLRVNVGRRRFFLFLSHPVPGRIMREQLVEAQMECGYALSRMPGLLLAAASEDPLSDRERECLLWVSEGKTTEDVAMILGVSGNTVSSYITHAIRKLGALNRPMAIASAIRSGII